MNKILFALSFFVGISFFSCRRNGAARIEKAENAEVSAGKIVQDAVEIRAETRKNGLESAITAAIEKTSADFPDICLAVAAYSPSVDFSYFAGKTSLPDGILCGESTVFNHWCAGGQSATAATILMLRERGVLSLGDKISDFLPRDLFNPNVINPDATIESLLKESAGIPNFSGTKTPKLLEKDAPFSNPNAKWSAEAAIKFAQTLVDGGENAWKDREGQYRHSTFNALILGMIAESATGRKFNDLAREFFFAPLNLDIRLAPQDEIDYKNAPRGHVWTESGGTPTDVASLLPFPPELFLDAKSKYVWTTAGYFSTMKDFTRWIYELFSDKGSAIPPKVRGEIWASLTRRDEKSRDLTRGLAGLSRTNGFAICEGGDMGECVHFLYSREYDLAIGVHYCMKEPEKAEGVAQAVFSAVVGGRY